MCVYLLFAIIVPLPGDRSIKRGKRFYNRSKAIYMSEQSLFAQLRAVPGDTYVVRPELMKASSLF